MNTWRQIEASDTYSRFMFNFLSIIIPFVDEKNTVNKALPRISDLIHEAR